MTTEIHKANLKFVWDLYKKLAEQNRGENVFFSPISVMAALSMTLAGARNNSELEMKQTLHLNEVDGDKLHSSVGQLLLGLNKVTDGVSMSLANKLYLDGDLQLVPEFLNLVKKEYASEVIQVDFQKEFEQTRLIINNWVEEQTQQKIKDLLPSGSLNSSTRAVLVNAIYFKGVWQKPFKVKHSYDGPFSRLVNDPNPLNLKYMKIEDEFNFARNDELQCAVLEIPFKGESASMALVLPDEIDGLAKLEAQLNADSLNKLLRETKRVTVEVHLPRFKLESTFNLEEVLPELGMRDVFEENKADLSGMFDQSSFPGKIRISKVIHKSFLNLDEMGAEAAAATAKLFIALGPRRDFKTEKWIGDHPFLLAIKDRESGVLFFGRMMVPNAE